MTNKVILKKEQALAIENVITDKESAVEMHVNGRWNGKPRIPLNDLSTDELIKALYIGYEVEPEFKVGDYVHHVKNNVTLLLDEEHRAEFVNNDYLEKEYIRPATPEEIAEEKERRFWKKHGRDVWELKSRDVILEVLTRQVYAVDYVEGSYVHFSDSDYDELSNVKNGYIVLTFAENRLDVKTNE